MAGTAGARSTTVTAPCGAVRRGAAGARVPARIDWYVSRSTGPGSMPSSSRSSRRPSWCTASASPCRAHRYRALISCARSCSRSGKSATRRVSSGTSRACRPSSRSASMRPSSAVIRASSRAGSSAAARNSATFDSAGPCQRSSASRSRAAALSYRPAARSAWPRAARCSNSVRSNRAVRVSSTYPGWRRRSSTPDPSRLRSRDTYV